MTREERNTKLKHFITCLKCEVSGRECDDNCPVQYKAGNMGEIIENLEAISKALEQEPCEDELDFVQEHKKISCNLIVEPCEDCISRQAVLDINEHYHGQMPNHINYEIWKEIKALPSVQPQPKTGRWIADVDRWGDIATSVNGYKCSECNTFEAYKDKYCPNCGAKMERSEE